jgi:hypothetical protein
VTMDISVNFLYDYMQPFLPTQPWCDRNLVVDYIQLQQNQTTQAPKNRESLIGKTKYVAFNQLLGYVSASRGSDAPLGTDMSKVPDANQTFLSYRIMYNNPNVTTFPVPSDPDSFINARVDNPYIIETPDNTTAGSLRDITTTPNAPMYFFCAHRTKGNNVKCIYYPNPI